MNEMNYENKPELSKKEQKRLAREEKRNAKADAKAAKEELARHNAANPFRPTFRWDGSKRHRTAKRVVGLLLALALTVSVTAFCIVNIDALPGFFSSFLPSDNVSEGNCGSEETNDVVRWELSGLGVLTISGKGEMQAYKRFEDAPWASKADEIKTISIGDEVEWVSVVGFSGCKNLESFRVSEKNTNYAVSANGLYSADFATLYLYPAAARSISYTVVDGTKHIVDGAFSGNAYLETVSLPTSLLTIGKDALASCEKLKTVVYAGNEAEWEKLSAGLNIGGKITVSLNVSGSGTGAISGLKPDHFYDYLAVSSDVTRGELATILSDGSTVFLKAGKADAYLEVTIPCERPGIYGLTMKEYHSVGRLSYVTLINRSVTYWSNISSGNRYPELSSEIPDAKTLKPEDYAVPISVSTGEYTEYYAYTYLQAGLNRVRIALLGTGSDKDYDIGINSLRFDLLSADTENTETVFATDSAVIDHFGTGEGVGRNSNGTGSFHRGGGSFDVNINIKKEAIYDVYLMSAGTMSSFSLVKNGVDQILKGASVGSAAGSTSLIPVHLGSTRLYAGNQTLTFKFTASFLNFGAIRFVPQGEDPLGSQTVEGIPEMSLGEGEIDLMPEVTPLGNSADADGVFKVKSGVSNALQATVRVEKAGVYALRLRGVFNGEYFLRNTTNDPASLFATANADSSLGWQFADDGYGNYTVYQYLSSGENTLKFWSSASATVEGMKLVPLTEDEPTLVLLSTNVAGATASASKSYYWSKLKLDDTLTYEFRVTEDGEYLLSGLVGGAAAKITVLDASGVVVSTLDYDPAPNSNAKVGIMGNSNAVVYAEMMSVMLSAGEYQIVVTGMTAADSHYSQLYLTKKGASESGVVWANTDFAPSEIPMPSDLTDAININAVKVKADSKSGIALNGSLLIYGGRANGVYFEVEAASAGFYQLEFAMTGRNMEKAYARLYNPAVTGEMSSSNRDPYLGNKRNELGYSPYGYYVYLAEGKNTIYFEHDGGESGYYEVVAARLYRTMSANYAAMLNPIKDKSTPGVSFSNHVAQLRVAGYQPSITVNQRAAYEFAPTVTGLYKVNFFLAGTANVHFRLYEGTGDAKKIVPGALSADAAFVEKTSDGLLFTVANAIKAMSTFAFDGSNDTTTYAPDVCSAFMQAGKTYTLEIECADKSSYLNTGAIVLAYAKNEGKKPVSVYPKMKIEDLRSDNLLPVAPSETPDNIYNGALADQLIAAPEIKGDDLIASVKNGDIVPGSGSDFVSDSYGIAMRSDATVTVTVAKTGIYKLVLSAFAKEDVLLTATANGMSAMITCVRDSKGAENGDDAADRSYYEVYAYLVAGENTVTLSGKGLDLYAVLFRGVEEVQTPIAHRNFLAESALPDNALRPEGYYVLREGDSVGIKEAYISVDAGFKWLSAFVGGEGYLTYTFKNLDNGEKTSVTYELSKALEGQSLSKMDLGYARFGYVNLSAGRYTISVSLAKGSYAVITASFLADEGHTHVYDQPMSKAPTCTEDGATWTECFCGAVEEGSYVVVPATNVHDYDETVVGLLPTCVSSGYYIKVCKVCGDTVENWRNPIAATGIHTFSPWDVVEPTLTAEGSAERHCIYCDEAETRQIAKKESRYESISIDVTKITLNGTHKVLTFSCSVSKPGFYQIRMNTLLTPQEGKTDETYIKAVSSAAPGYSSIGKSYLNEDKTAYEFSTGLSVYLAAGENTVTLTAEGAFDAEIAELTLVNQSAMIDHFALCEGHVNFGQNYLENKEAKATVTIAETGFYHVGYLMGIGGKTNISVRFQKGEESVLTYSFTVSDAASLLPKEITAVSGSTNATQYVAGDYIYLEAGEYTVTVTPEVSSFFCFAGMTFTFADPIPSVDTEDGSIK